MQDKLRLGLEWRDRAGQALPATVGPTRLVARLSGSSCASWSLRIRPGYGRW
jgi:hypothetical protein